MSYSGLFHAWRRNPQDEVSRKRQSRPPSHVAAWRVGFWGWIGAHRLIVALFVGAAMAVIGGAILAVRLAKKPLPRRRALPVENALEALDRGRYDEARRLAEAFAPRGQWKRIAKGLWPSFSER